MTRFVLFRLSAVLAMVFGFGLAATSAGAAEMTWKLRSDANKTISLQFYSQDRNIVWPEPDEVYVIDDDATHSYPLACNDGEKVCYGAWVRNNSDSYWGSGYDGEQSCDSCCFTCGGGSIPVLVLDPN